MRRCPCSSTQVHRCRRRMEAAAAAQSTLQRLPQALKFFCLIIQ
jgi:hypothetical protein